MVIAAILIVVSLILTLVSVYKAFVEGDDETGGYLLIYAILADLAGSTILVVSKGF